MGLWLQLFVTSAAADPIQAQEAFLQAFFQRESTKRCEDQPEQELRHGLLRLEPRPNFTNAHVVGDQEIVSVTLRNGTELKGKVIEKGRDGRDVALVKIDMEGTPGLTIAGFDRMRVGSWAASIGHGEGAIWSFNTGMVSNIYRTGERLVLPDPDPAQSRKLGWPYLQPQWPGDRHRGGRCDGCE